MGKRQYKRYTPGSLMQAVNALDDHLLGTVMNISQGGFMLASHGSIIPEGAIYQLRLQEEQTAMDINLGATCLWQTEANATDSHWAGFQIIDISAEDEAVLISYIAGLEA